MKDGLIIQVDPRKPWDEQTATDLVAQMGDFTEDLRLSNEKLGNMYNGGDDEFPEPKVVAAYQMESIRNRNLLDRVQMSIKQVEDFHAKKPMTNAEIDGPRGDMMRAVRTFTAGGGIKNLTAEQRERFVPELDAQDLAQNPLLARGEYMAIKLSDNPGRRPLNVTRSDITTGSGAAGEAVITEWDPMVIEALSFLGGVANAAAEITTETGGKRIYNQMDSGTAEGELLTDQAGTSITTQDLPVVGKVEMEAYVMHSKMMSVRLEAEQDVHFSLEERAMREAARRLGRGWNKQFTLGTGTDAPQGIVPISRTRDAGTASLNSISYANIIGLEEDVDEAYLMGSEMAPGGFTDVFSDGYIGYMFHRSVEFRLRQQLDSDMRPLWITNHDIGQAIQGSPGILNNYSYFLNQHMQAMGTNNHKPIVFGNFGHYMVRNIPEFGVFRFFDSNTIQTLSTWYLAITRRDGKLLGPTTLNLADALVALQIKS